MEIYFLLMNVVAFAAFGIDKRRARLDQWRIPEARLFSYALLGGSAGALLGMALFRHKTQKPLFAIGIPIVLLAQLALLALFLLSGFGNGLFAQ